MSEEKKELQEQMYGKGAAGYDQRIRSLFAYYDSIHAATNSILRCLLKPESHVLAVGCGTGAEILQLGEANSSWRFTGVDPAAPMVELARQKTQAAGISDRVSFFEGFLSDLASDTPFDAATLSMVLHFLPDDGSKRALLEDIAMCLREDAPLVLMDLHGDLATPESNLSLMAWQQQQHLGGATWEEVEEWRNNRFNALHFVSADRIQQLLSDSGFTKKVHHFFQNFMLHGWLAFKS